MRRTVAALATALLLSSFTLPSGADATTTLTIGGPPLAGSVLGLLAETYVHYGLRFRLVPTGEAGGVRKVARGEIDIGTTAQPSRPARPGLSFTEFARQAVCVTTNPSNPLPSLTRSQVTAIFTGRTRNWSEVPGAKATGPIDLVAYRNPRLRADALERRLGLAKLVPNTDWGILGIDVAEAVAGDPAAIGYLPPSTAEAGHLVAFGGVPCTRPNVESGRYPASLSLYWATKGAPKGAAKEFLDWVETSPRARREIESEAYAVR